MKKQLLILLTALMLSLGASAQMVLQFDTNKSDGTTITLPLYRTVNVTVNWGDGSSNTYTEAGNQDHTYATEGTYTVEISGSLTQFGQHNYPNADKLVKVTSFGDIGLYSLDHAFHNAVNLVEVPTQLPSSVNALEFTFREAINFNLDISGWDVSNVFNMRGLFRGASSFNQDISNWDVSNVGNMDYMFFNATAFNQDIGNWDVSKAYSMSSMFDWATSFNQNIGSWNVGKVTSMDYMFRGATAFNQDISGWDVSKVYNMNYMFRGATAFNQDISGWDVSKVLEMPSMFSNATAFNQDLGSWNVTSVTNMTDMFAEVTLSTANYNSLLIGWAAQTVKNGVVFSGGNSKYSPGAATDARAVLAGTTNNWIITDGGESNALAVSTHVVSDITTTTATSGGNVFADGGSSITARGVVWGTTANPTIANNTGITTDGSGTGTFTSSITGLTENTTYHVRAYATNAE
ncbi:MAG: BspA family leucine-rich repeat surface protein, partial [Bacteroidales bacterium]